MLVIYRAPWSLYRQVTLFPVSDAPNDGNRKLPLLINEKSYATCEWYAIGSKLELNTGRKPWLLYRLVPPLPVSDVTGMTTQK
jgi:hypothetical protein